MSEKKPSTVFNKNSEQRRKTRTKWIFAVVFLLLVLVAGAVAFLRKSEFQISSIQVTGTKALDPDEVQQSAERFVSGNYAMVVPRTNVLLFSKDGMAKFLMSKFPGIASLHVSFIQRNVLQVSIAEKSASFVWCDAASCYFVDDTGLIYEESPRFSDGVFLAFTGATLNVLTPPIGSRFVPVPVFQSVLTMVNQLTGYPLEVVGVSFQDSGDIAFRFDELKGVPVNPNAVLMVAKDTTADTVTQDLDLLTADTTFSDDLAAEPSQLQYIDARFDGKIYYKFGTTASSPVASASSASTTQ